MDVLSEVLKAVKLDGALFYNAEFSAPWCVRTPASRVVAPHLGPGPGHVIIFHLVTEGRGYAHVEGDDLRVELNAGDIVIFPHGDPHIIGNGAPVKPVDHERELQRVLAQGLKLSRSGGGGPLTKLVCGYMACEPQLCQVFLGGLPPVFKVHIRDDASGQWLENSIRYSVGDVNSWLAGVRDPEVGRVLGLLHRRPAHPWTIAELAAEVGISRSVLAERFRCYLSETPIAYLTRWRLQLGAQMLKSTSGSVLHIASEVGYESEPSFNRAFKREFGLPPARFRTQSKSARVGVRQASANSQRALSR